VGSFPIMRLMPLEDPACESEKEAYEPSEDSICTATPKAAGRNLGEHWSTRVRQLRQIFEAGRLAQGAGSLSPQQAYARSSSSTLPRSSSSAATLPEVTRVRSGSDPYEELGSLRDVISDLQQRISRLQAQVSELDCRFTPERVQELIEATLSQASQGKPLPPIKLPDKQAMVSDGRLTPRYSLGSFKPPRSPRLPGTSFGSVDVTALDLQCSSITHDGLLSTFGLDGSMDTLPGPCAPVLSEVSELVPERQKKENLREKLVRMGYADVRLADECVQILLEHVETSFLELLRRATPHVAHQQLPTATAPPSSVQQRVRNLRMEVAPNIAGTRPHPVCSAASSKTLMAPTNPLPMRTQEATALRRCATPEHQPMIATRAATAECLPSRAVPRASSANALEVRRPVGKGRSPVRHFSRRCTLSGPVPGRCSERRHSVGRLPEGRREASTSPAPFNRFPEGRRGASTSPTPFNRRLPNIVIQDRLVKDTAMPRTGAGAAVLAPRSCSPQCMPVGGSRGNRLTNMLSPMRQQSLSPAPPRQPRPSAPHATSPASMHSGHTALRQSRSRTERQAY